MSCGADGLCYRGEGGTPPGDGGPPDGGGDGPVDAGSACGGRRLEDFSDDFDDLSAWTVVGDELDTCVVDAQAGHLTVSTAEPGTCGVESRLLYDFIDQSATIRIDDENVNQGTPDMVFRAIVANQSVELVWYDQTMTARNCPDTGGCENPFLVPGGLHDWWRLRHDPVEHAIAAEVSSTGAGYPDGHMFTVSDEDAACVRLFIGSTGQLTDELTYPIHIDRLNIP